MGLALWCDVKDTGHAFDERDAIVVNPDGEALYFCKEHCISAFVAAFGLAHSTGGSRISLPFWVGSFTVTPADSQTARVGQPAAAAQGDASLGDGRSPDSAPGAGARQVGAAGKAKPLPGDRARKSAQAIADLLEAGQPPGGRTPAAMNYGGRA